MVVATGALSATEPNLAVTLRGSLDATVGQKLTLRVTAEPAGSSVAVHDAPRGLELVGESLVWTPTEAQVGTHTVALKVSAGDDDEKIGEWTVVHPPSVRVTGIGTMTAVADDGKTAVVLSVDRPPNGGDGTWKLTLADLTTMKVLGASEVAVNGRAVAVDAHHAYLAVAGEVVALRKKDMTVAKRLPVLGQPAVLAAVANRWLFVGTDAGKTQVFAVPDGRA